METSCYVPKRLDLSWIGMMQWLVNGMKLVDGEWVTHMVSFSEASIPGAWCSQRTRVHWFCRSGARHARVIPTDMRNLSRWRRLIAHPTPTDWPPWIIRVGLATGGRPETTRCVIDCTPRSPGRNSTPDHVPRRRLAATTLSGDVDGAVQTVTALGW